MTDPGSHYRREYRGVKLDPYRIALIYGITHPTQFQMLKKLLRGTSKGHTEEQLVEELGDCVRRWREMQLEDSELSPSVPRSAACSSHAGDIQGGEQ